MRRRGRLASIPAAAIAVAICAIAQPARAQRAPADEAASRLAEARAAASEPPAPAAPLRWYGWEILLADIPAYVTFELGRPYTLSYGTPPSYGVIDAAVPMYLASGPIVHTLNDRWRVSFASVGVRLTAAWTGWWIGLAQNHACVEVTGPLNGSTPRCAIMYEGMTIGAAVGTAIDALALGWKPERTAPMEKERAARASEAFVAPVITPSFVGLGGRF